MSNYTLPLSLEKFFLKYPLFKFNYENKTYQSKLKEDGFYLCGYANYSFIASIIHELSHFLQREDNKTFLDNFGFTSEYDIEHKKFLTKWNSYDALVQGYQRDLKVASIERTLWKMIMPVDHIYLGGYEILSKLCLSEKIMNKFGTKEDINNFYDEQLKIHDSLWFYDNLERKYNLLKIEIINKIS